MAIIALIASAVLVGIDQLLKAIVVANMVEFQSIPCIPGLLNWTYILNEGAAFGILPNQRWFFIVLTIVLIGICLGLLFCKAARSSKWITVTLSLIIAGGVGNLIDRIATGKVVDYISVSFFPPIFNFADCCVVIGAIMAVIYFLILEPRKAKLEAIAAVEAVASQESNADPVKAEESLQGATAEQNSDEANEELPKE